MYLPLTKDKHSFKTALPWVLLLGWSEKKSTIVSRIMNFLLVSISPCWKFVPRADVLPIDDHPFPLKCAEVHAVDGADVAQMSLVTTDDVDVRQHHSAASPRCPARHVPSAFLADPQINSSTEICHSLGHSHIVSGLQNELQFNLRQEK